MNKENIINVMKRYELKYYLSKDQLIYFQKEIARYMKIDKYGLTSIASLYFDTPTYSLINKSIEKPYFKEKIRLRSYGLANITSPTYLEVKRKCEGIVYKRRVRLLEDEAYSLIKDKESKNDDQIARELEFFMNNYSNLEAKYLIIYDRLAYYQDNSDLRITIDLNPRYRTSDLNLHTSLDGIPLFKEEGAILEIKVQHSVPLWLVEILTKGHIYQTSISKVGEAHKLELAKAHKEINHLLINQKTRELGGYQYGFTI